MQPAIPAEIVDDGSGVRGRFRVLMELGRGGMATVYLAERASLDIRKLVVLKVLNVALAAHEEMRSAFRREAHLSARMNHPNVVQVFEVVEHAGQAIIVMEYLDGMPLSRVVRQSALPLTLHLDILLQALDGLHHFHELTDLDGSALNPVHRDVSPQNILVLHDGGAKVLDFGIAKLQTSDEDHTQIGLIKGKLHYMPPEQLTGSRVDRRADIFAMGVMLWEALAGRRLWEGRSDLDVMKALARGDIPSLRKASPDVASELEAIVERALEPDADDRFATARDMQTALEEAVRRTVGAVRSRDIAAFMRERFAELRKEQRLRLEAVRRQPGAGAFETQSGLSWVPMPWRTGEPVPAGLTLPTAGLTEAHELSAAPALVQAKGGASYRRLAWAAIGVGVAWVALVAIRSHSKTSTVVAQPATGVQFNVLVDPADAEILLDGKFLGSGRYQGVHSDTGGEHRLQIRAAGCVSVQENVRFRSDVVRLIRLRPLPVSAPAGDVVATRLTTDIPSSKELDWASPRSSIRPHTTAQREATSTRSSTEASAPAQAPRRDAVVEVPAPAGPVVPAPAPSAASAAATSVARPRQVAPKIGQDLLAVNVSADPYRIRPPRALQKVAGTLDTMVRICVSASGGVSAVSVLKSADPALDRQISATVPRWRYRPLQDEGVAVPFCYTTRMRFVGG